MDPTTQSSRCMWTPSFEQGDLCPWAKEQINRWSKLNTGAMNSLDDKAGGRNKELVLHSLWFHCVFDSTRPGLGHLSHPHPPPTLPSPAHSWTTEGGEVKMTTPGTDWRYSWEIVLVWLYHLPWQAWRDGARLQTYTRILSRTHKVLCEPREERCQFLWLWWKEGLMEEAAWKGSFKGQL